MSLRVIHIFLISVSILLSIGFGYWCFAVDAGLPAFIGWLSFAAGIALIAYLFFFIRKIKV